MKTICRILETKGVCLGGKLVHIYTGNKTLIYTLLKKTKKKTRAIHILHV